MNNNRIGYYTEGSFYKNSQGNIFSSDIFILFFQKLFFNKNIKTIGRLSPNKFSHKYSLNHKFNLTTLSNYKSISNFLLIFPFYLIKNRKAINNFIDNIDILFITASGPLSIFLLMQIRKRNKKAVIFIRQNTRELISVKHNHNFFAKIMGNLIESYIENFVKNYTKITVFTFGSEIYNRYKKLSKSTFSIADSRFHETDILKESDLVKLNYSTIKFLYVGRLAPGKGLEFLIKALSKINNFKFTLTIIGEGILKNELIKLVEKYNLGNKVIFKGHIYFSEKLLEEFSSHDVFVLPSFSEGFPQVVVEAMARGVIVIASKVGGIPDQIENNKNGFLFPAGNETDFLNIINQINQNKIDSFLIRKNGIRTSKMYTFENQRKIIFDKLGFNINY